MPKYINRPVEPQDKERFQTIYAKNEGAVAAPTAGLHFSKHLLKKLEIKGVLLPEITLHIGLGTFSPVDVEDLSKHKMDSGLGCCPFESVFSIVTFSTSSNSVSLSV